LVVIPQNPIVDEFDSDQFPLPAFTIQEPDVPLAGNPNNLEDSLFMADRNIFSFAKVGASVFVDAVDVRFHFG